MTAFLVVAGVGAVLLVISMVLDGVADVIGLAGGFEMADGLFSTTAIGAALTLLGATGYVTLASGGGVLLALGLGSVLGGAVMVLVSRLVKAMKARITPVPVLAAGARGKAVGAIRGVGEVLVDGELNKRLARTTGPAIDDGARVLVVDREEPYLIVIADETSREDTTRWPQADSTKEV